MARTNTKARRCGVVTPLLFCFLVVLTATRRTVAQSSNNNEDPNRRVSPRVLMRERFPSGLKIDRFSTSWPSSASVMADMLEGATAREMLEKQRRSLSKQQYENQVREANRLMNSGQTSLGKPVQNAPAFSRQNESGGKGGALTTGLLYVLLLLFSYANF